MINNIFKNLRARAGREDGVAILLTVMIVSGITVISVTVAAFVLQEVRSARSSALTEPAIIAAETAGEQGIYQVKRSSFSGSCATASYTHLDGSTTGGSTNTRIKKCITTQPAVQQVTAATPWVFFLYDHTNVQRNTCMEVVCPFPATPIPDADGVGSGNQLYTSLVITSVTGTTSLNVDIDTVSGSNYDSGTVPPGNTGIFGIDRDILGASDERLRVTLTPTSGTLTVSVSTTGEPGWAPGLPDYQTIDAEGCVGLTDITSCDSTNEIYKRRINITLPR